MENVGASAAAGGGCEAIGLCVFFVVGRGKGLCGEGVLKSSLSFSSFSSLCS